MLSKVNGSRYGIKLMVQRLKMHDSDLRIKPTELKKKVTGRNIDRVRKAI